MSGPNRREALAVIAAGVATAGLSQPMRTPRITKPIPSSGELIPVIGMGTWITFNVGDDQRLRAARTEVLRAFFAQGGGMIDSSPMYGSAQAVVGAGLKALGHPKGLFSADKVWTRDGATDAAVAEAQGLWGVQRFDLMQVHNLVSWERHLARLFELKAAGKLRYVGVTTSHGRRHAELAKVMRSHPLDFVQLTYNVADIEAEKRLLPLAEERGIAVIANRPFQRGALPKHFAGKRLPDWAAAINCTTWAQVLLKWIVSHPAITCAIPATSQVAHLRENMDAARGPMPDGKLRSLMHMHLATH